MILRRRSQAVAAGCNSGYAVRPRLPHDRSGGGQGREAYRRESGACAWLQARIEAFGLLRAEPRIAGASNERLCGLRPRMGLMQRASLETRRRSGAECGSARSRRVERKRF